MQLKSHAFLIEEFEEPVFEVFWIRKLNLQDIVFEGVELLQVELSQRSFGPNFIQGLKLLRKLELDRTIRVRLSEVDENWLSIYDQLLLSLLFLFGPGIVVKEEV